MYFYSSYTIYYALKRISTPIYKFKNLWGQDTVLWSTTQQSSQWDSKSVRVVKFQDLGLKKWFFFQYSKFAGDLSK